MPFFKRWRELKERIQAGLRDRRGDRRYPVRPDFPLTVTLRSVTRGALEAAGTKEMPPQGWRGSLQDLCSNGANVRLPAVLRFPRGHKMVLAISLDDRVLEIPGAIAHAEVFADHTVCGLFLQFTEIETQHTFVRFLRAMAVGASLVRRESTGVAGLHVERYESDGKSRLTVWRDGPQQAIESFELVVENHCFRGEANGTALGIYIREENGRTAKKARSAPGFLLSDEDRPESRRFYRWTSLNLPDTLPADLREMLQRFGRTPVLSEGNAIAKDSA